MRCRESLPLLLAVAALAGCGGQGGGKATIWVTRDRGAHVILRKGVPSGLTAMQALDRVTDLDTRYAGRYVQAINGLQGSLSARRDWFYFINGYEADRSAAEYRLHDGDVEWWDLRSWRARMREPVVIGAFPEPFLHGWAGKTRPARVVYRDETRRKTAERLARLIGGTATRRLSVLKGGRFNVLVLAPRRKRPFLVGALGGDGSPGGAVRFTFGGPPALLERAPPFGRLRYQVPP
jgi:Domain of unknown function (DUF4430)